MKNRTEFIRVEKTNNFSIIHNGFLRRDDLSWKSKGILTYILSLPDDWNINLNEIMRHATEGEKAFRSGWKELTDAGYVERYAVRDDVTKKITHWETVVKENVDITMNKPHTQNLHVGKVDVGKVHVGNGNLLSTYSTKDLTKQSTNNTKSNIPAKAEPHIPFEEIVSYLNEKTNSNYKHTTKVTQNLIKARVNDGFELNDFKQVIEVKANQWLNDKEMSKYLRPQTLFGTKFESYLNEQTKGNNDIDKEPDMEWLSTDNIFG